MPDAQMAFVHASDLHIGPNIVSNRFQFFSGYSPHDIQLCRGFEEAFADASVSCGDNNLRLVVTGDITAGGLQTEFAAAHTYLTSVWVCARRGGPNDKVALNLPLDRLETIPGNHDHWDGSRFPVYSYRPNAVAPHFRKLPWRHCWIDNTGSLELELFSIDSNSGATGRNPLGQGIVAAADFNILHQLFQSSPPVRSGAIRVRAILIHHSPSYRGSSLMPRVLAPLVLDKTSVDTLVDLSTTNGVSAILTGHTHDVFHYTFWKTIAGNYREVHEIRSPTTLQGPAAKTGAGFLLHRISVNQQAGPHWTTWHYAWDGSQFVVNPQPLVGFRTA
jgi:hypothetical protein